MVTSQTEKKDKAEAEAKAKAEAEEENPDKSGEAEAKVETEEKAEGEEKAKAEVETEEKTETETEAKTEAETVEEKDKPEAETKVEAEEKTGTEPETKPETEAAEEPKAEAEKKDESKEKPEAEAVEEADKPGAKTEAEEKVETEKKTTAPDQSQVSAKGVVSEAIQKLTQSMTVPTGEPGKPTMGTLQGGNPAHISVPSTICAKDIMQKDVTWAGPEESVQQALTKMQQHDSSYIIVGQDGALEGIVSKSDITGATSIYLRPIFAKWHGPGDDATLQIKLKWIMSRPVRTIRPDAPLAAIIDNMCRFGGRGLPVADEQGKVHGLVTVFDIFQTLLNTLNTQS